MEAKTPICKQGISRSSTGEVGISLSSPSGTPKGIPKGTPKGTPNFIMTKFEDIPVSTKTSIVMTNLSINIAILYQFLPITEYIVVQKKRGRRKKNVAVDPNKNIPSGAIITVELENGIRGVRLKKKKRST